MNALDAMWYPPLEGLALSDADVHVWRASLDQPVERLRQLAQLLSADERDRAERLRSTLNRKRFVAARGFLRVILSRYTNLKPDRIRFRYGDWGKPELSRGEVANAGGCVDLCFNLSHAEGLALYGFARGRRLGIDLEVVRPVAEMGQIVPRCFSARERVLLQARPARDRRETFLSFWACKEAYLKAFGTGLAGFTGSLDNIDVAQVPLAPAKSLVTHAGSEGATERPQCSLQRLVPSPGYTAALALEGFSGWHLSCWQFSDA